MGGPFFWLLFLIVCGAIVYINWLLLRDCPTDRYAIDNFAGQRGWRIISVTRSYNFLRYWFRGTGVDNAVRFYEVLAENAEGDRGDIHVAFDSLFGPGQLVVLEQHGLAPTPPGGSASLTQPDSGTTGPSRRRRELLLLFVAGAGFGGFLFGGILQTILSPPRRPVFPEPALGFTHLFNAKYGSVYGTYFEYLAVTYGFWMMWIVGVVSSVFRKIKLKPRTSPGWQGLAAIAVSMALYYAIWRLSIYAARS
jgi:hypothetical protein